MFGRKIFFLISGYVAGNVVHAVYSGKKKNIAKIQKKEDIKIIAKNFLETQKNFIQDIEKKVLSESSRESFAENKEKFLKIAEGYIKEGEKLVKEIESSERFQEGKKKAIGWFSSLSGSVKNFISSFQEKTEHSENYSVEEIIPTKKKKSEK